MNPGRGVADAMQSEVAAEPRSIEGTRRKQRGRRALFTGGLAAVALVAVGITSEVLAKHRSPAHWAGTWSMSPQGPQTFEGTINPGLTNQTVRQIAHVSLGGRTLRVRLSNAYGATPLTIGAAHVALQSSGASIVPHTDRTLTFGGRRTFRIPAGAVVVSDPVDLDVPAASNLAVSLHVPEATGPASWHLTAIQTTYISGAGDHTAARAFPTARTESSVYWLSGVEVEAAERTRVIVGFGDSITDGYGATEDAHRRWPDVLSARLNGGRRYGQVGVLNQGISGNRVLHDIVGSNALARFDRDVLAQPGVTDVVVLEGINDFGGSGPSGNATENVSAADLYWGLQQLAERAHAQGIRIFAGTLTPFEGTVFEGYFTPEGEAKRQALNAALRGSQDFDGVIDFDAALRDPKQPSRMLAEYDSGDHLHPNDAGYAAMAAAAEAVLTRR